MNKILDGKELSNKIKKDLMEKISILEIKPKLVVIQIGNDSASDVYIKMKEKVSNELGILYEHIKYEENTDEIDIVNKIKELNNDNRVNGIIVQLPIPKKFNKSLIINTIDSNKDVDGLNYINSGKLVHDEECLISCTPLGIMNLLNHYNVLLEGKHVVIVGRSILVGKPLINLFLNKNATVTICHSKTKDLEKFTKQANILVVAVGKKHLIKNNMIKDGVIIIDVGINRENNKIYGDVDFDDVYEKVKYITPVPGGVGPMTVVSLMQNVIKAYNIQKK